MKITNALIAFLATAGTADAGALRGRGLQTACAPVWKQCSGKTFNEGIELCCEAGSTCVASSAWYGQCKPASNTGWSGATSCATDASKSSAVNK